MRKVYWVLPLFLTACKNDKQENGSVIFGNQPVTEEMRETGSIASDLQVKIWFVMRQLSVMRELQEERASARFSATRI